MTGGINGIENVRETPAATTWSATRAAMSWSARRPGTDVIQGGSGASILIGNTGKDRITGGTGGAILISGATNYDASGLANDLALDSILDEWQSGQSYSTSIKHIMNGVGTNGSIQLVWKTTVHDDGSANRLTGGARPELVFQRSQRQAYQQEGGRASELTTTNPP